MQVWTACRREIFPPHPNAAGDGGIYLRSTSATDGRNSEYGTDHHSVTVERVHLFDLIDHRSWISGWLRLLRDGPQRIARLDRDIADRLSSPGVQNRHSHHYRGRHQGQGGHQPGPPPHPKLKFGDPVVAAGRHYCCSTTTGREHPGRRTTHCGDARTATLNSFRARHRAGDGNNTARRREAGTACIRVQHQCVSSHCLALPIHQRPVGPHPRPTRRITVELERAFYRTPDLVLHAATDSGKIYRRVGRTPV